MPIPVQQFNFAPTGLAQSLSQLLQGGMSGYKQGLGIQQARQQMRHQDMLEKQMQEQLKIKQDQQQEFGQLVGQQGSGIDPVTARLANMLAQSGDMRGAIGMLQPKEVKPTSVMQNARALGLQPGTKAYDDYVRDVTLKPSTQVNIGRLSPSEAGKGGMYEQARKDSSLVKDYFLDEKGEPNFKNIALATELPFVGVIPKSPGGAAHNAMDGIIQAFLRAETGAAATPSEVKNIKSRYMPSVTDSADLVKKKINSLIQRLDATKKMYDPEGRYDQNVPRGTQSAQIGNQSISYGGRTYTRSDLERIAAGGQ